MADLVAILVFVIRMCVMLAFYFVLLSILLLYLFYHINVN